jgi:hypothetical protein
MKRIQKITRVQLNIDHDEKFFLLAIVSAEPDYKLSLSINSKLGISLKNISPLKIAGDNGSEILFSRFSYITGSPEIIFTLVSNRSGKHFLLKKLKNVDYVFKIYQPEYENKIDRIIASLREVESVNAVFNVEADILKDKMLKLLNQ